MNRCIRRSYEFSGQEVREILIGWMKDKDLPRPSYVGNTDTTTWFAVDGGGARVEWTDADQVDVPDGKPTP